MTTEPDSNFGKGRPAVYSLPVAYEIRFAKDPAIKAFHREFLRKCGARPNDKQFKKGREFCSNESGKFAVSRGDRKSFSTYACFECALVGHGCSYSDAATGSQKKIKMNENAEKENREVSSFAMTKLIF
ncbi:MAG: hypothetical protein Q9228_007536 [Teloschistes exilis]